MFDFNICNVSGATPAGAATGHPAICEPVNTSDCITKNSWIQDCPAKDVVSESTTVAAGSTTVVPDTATEAATAGSNAETTTAQVEEANNGAETTTVPAETTTTSKSSSTSSLGVCLVLTMIATLLL